MILRGNRVYLRDYIFNDINDHILWNTLETEWLQWDAPWEQNDFDVNRYIDMMTQRLLLPKTDLDIRWSFQIAKIDDDTHIGWVSSYDIDNNYEYTQDAKNLTLGIDIPLQEHRSCGFGKEALTLFINYYKSKGYKELYTQTWSGNFNMVKLAQSLGFLEAHRIKNFRLVDGLYYDALTFKLTF
jgi:RimJ/RimL family protein N-acetyltransferase